MIPEAKLAGARPRLSFRARLQVDKITGKPVLLFPEGALMLNPTGHAIVSLCDGRKTVPGNCFKSGGTLQSAAQEISLQVANYLNKLRARNLLDLLDETEVKP